MTEQNPLNVEALVEQLAQRFADAELFYGHGTDNPFDEAVYLVYGALDLEFIEGSAQRVLTGLEIERLEQLAHRRITEQLPVAYLVGKAWFAGHEFLCDERALVPRSPFAELIQRQFSPLLKESPRRVLDLCTGGGCIGIATALSFTDCELTLADISPQACALANENLQLHGLGPRAAVIESDLFASLEGSYDLIVSNPPYVAASEIAELPTEYRHEPELGLLSAEEGLAIPLQILRQAADFLKRDGVLVMEVGFSHELLAERLPTVPLLWLEFEHGGEGVFSLTAAQLREFSDCFN